MEVHGGHLAHVNHFLGCHPCASRVKRLLVVLFVLKHEELAFLEDAEALAPPCEAEALVRWLLLKVALPRFKKALSIGHLDCARPHQFVVTHFAAEGCDGRLIKDRLLLEFFVVESERFALHVRIRDCGGLAASLRDQERTMTAAAARIGQSFDSPLSVERHRLVEVLVDKVADVNAFL